MAFWIVLIVFGIPLCLAVVLRRKQQQKYQNELEDIQRRIAEKEAENESDQIAKDSDP